MSDRYLHLDGALCRVRDHGGSGPPVVLIHGLGGNADNWMLVAPSIAERHHTIALDLPGFGLSAPSRRHSLDSHAAAVTALIEHLDRGPVTVVGNSMGGIVAELVASDRPELVRRLVLVSPATAASTVPTPPDPGVAAMLAVQAIPMVGPAFTGAFQHRHTPDHQVARTLAIVARHPDRLPPRVRARAIEMAALRQSMPWVGRAFSESARSTASLLANPRRFATMIDEIDRPTTLIWGTADRVVSPRAIRRLASLRPDWRAVELAEVGHVPMLERPDVVIDEVLAPR